MEIDNHAAATRRVSDTTSAQPNGDAMEKVNDAQAGGKSKPDRDFPLWLHRDG